MSSFSLDTASASSPLARELLENVSRKERLAGMTAQKPEHTRVLTVTNQKGGVGKTTTTVNLAASLAKAGMRVLVVDLDPQGNATSALGIDRRGDIDGVYEVLLGGASLKDVVLPSAEDALLLCAPASLNLAGAEIELVSMPSREHRLWKALDAYLMNEEPRIDYVFIDCPPSLGLLTINAFVAASEVLIPIQCEYYALEGLTMLLQNIGLINERLNPTLVLSTIILTMFDGRTRLSNQVADEVRSHFPQQTLTTVIPRSVRVSEAPSYGQSVIAYDPSSVGALSYQEAAFELAERGSRGNA